MEPWTSTRDENGIVRLTREIVLGMVVTGLEGRKYGTMMVPRQNAAHLVLKTLGLPNALDGTYEASIYNRAGQLFGVRICLHGSSWLDFGGALASHFFNAISDRKEIRTKVEERSEKRKWHGVLQRKFFRWWIGNAC
ncbi:Thiamine thiazole synthase 1, chloroplastic [Sesamum angolense]|uniref:Thiamine thiazole synthase 1, chloroplastic n=1 Tax=Sesamum angolense TaxID=2727404 RepID=A0AAE2BUR5_9LAMI|nr:Thiamine thiazole synthase 1, chloroplastic [Sesamum angolense]